MFFIIHFIWLYSIGRNVTMHWKRGENACRANMHKQIELIREKQTLSFAVEFNMTLRVHNLRENNLKNKGMLF